MKSKKSWWQKTTIYQIYPRSFSDSNNDGIGDLRGITSRLDYINDLGFETIWISPFFTSPQADWGYDVSDFYNIAPEYGDMGDVMCLISEVHDRGMKILFDLVMNHTSDQHAWFLESRSSRDNPKRDWYIWKDGRGNRPPNNWKAIPGGAGWQYDEKTSQWYYTSFLPFQPDLNYRNPQVKEAMFDVVRYWLERGVDGFRLDIFRSIYKDAQLRDNPFSFRFAPTEYFTEGWFQKWEFNQNQPETFEFAKELRSYVDAHSTDGLLLGEVYGDYNLMRAYLGEQQDGLNLVFLWDLMKLKPEARSLRDLLQNYEKHYPEPFVPVYVFGNHDVKRLISKLKNNVKLAKLLAVFQFTVRGVPVVYYGEEIGMQEVNIPAGVAKDPLGHRYRWIPAAAVKLLDLYPNRDGCRTPMQWDGSDNAGFCSKDAVPWLPVHPDYHLINVEEEASVENSLLNVYKRLLRLRRESAAIREGTIRVMEGNKNENPLVFFRIYEDELILVVINFGGSPADYLNQSECNTVRFEIGMDNINHHERFTLPPYSGVILSN